MCCATLIGPTKVIAFTRSLLIYLRSFPFDVGNCLVASNFLSFFATSSFKLPILVGSALAASQEGQVNYARHISWFV
jgi:hypothetical protein